VDKILGKSFYGKSFSNFYFGVMCEDMNIDVVENIKPEGRWLFMMEISDILLAICEVDE
jgi:hypothetical protein